MVHTCLATLNLRRKYLPAQIVLSCDVELLVLHFAMTIKSVKVLNGNGLSVICYPQ